MQTPSPGAAKAASPPGSSGDTNKVSSEVYIADGDYIKDIEVNDLRNRYTLTKGSTQKMVNILLYPLILSGTPFSVPVVVSRARPLCLPREPHALERVEAYMTEIALRIPSFASADLHCVTSRSKKMLAPVRSNY